eukprot:TRINITY_DN10273_c0_g1_i1.p1 TRINITY_DN10273_c0_g1~~TRINITY_DN10273_c0_g1_i1.p1  ORF type:complete len:235 (-),score=70.88 TRINITY_DN10273_c0_g1_i1:396-1100(-)
MMRFATLLAYLACVLPAVFGSAPTAAPTAAPTSAPTFAPTNKPTAKPNSPVAPMSEVAFSLTIDTAATCSDLTAGSALMNVMKLTGAKMVGVKPEPPASAVAVTCSAARRLREGLARRLAKSAYGFTVQIPTAQKSAAETSVQGATVASVQAILDSAKTEAGASVTFAVDEAAITALKASVVVTDVTPSGSSNSTVGVNTTTTAFQPAESSSAFDAAPKCVALLYAILFAAALA